MHRTHLPIAVLAAVALLAAPRAEAAAPITSRILIDPQGENNGDFYGTSIAWVGDVNGDGYDDVLVGAFRYPEIGSVGRAYLYFGGPSMDAVPDLVIDPPPGGAGWFGSSVASAGDFNGDGYPDFIIGAQQAGYEGRAFIYYGGPALDAVPDVTLIGESTGSLTAFGASVASAGDVNGDGYGDVIVGAPTYGSGGRVYVFFGGPTPDAVPDRVFTAAGAFDQLGAVVGSAGDINGDGYDDVFASAPYNDTPALNAGTVYVWFGGPSFDTVPDLTVHGSGVNERLTNAANAGDVNGDGFSDLIASDKDHVYVWFGGSSPNAVPDLTIPVAYGTVSGGGDVNGDGIDDFIVGAPYDTSGGAGRVSVYFGGSAVDAVEDLHYVGDPSTGTIGQAVAGGGHVDGPGPADLITSLYWDPDSIGYNKGRIDVIANSAAVCDPPGPPPRFGCSWSTDECDWVCAVCDPFGTPPRPSCHWDSSLCNWICPGYTGVTVTVQTRRAPTAAATVHVNLSSLCTQTGQIAACQGQFTVGPGMSIAAKCQALADAVSGNCSDAGYAVATNDCAASATFTTSNVGCPQSQFALGISNDAATFDQSSQDPMPDGESESVTGICAPVASTVTGLRIDKSGDGSKLLISWDGSANAASYTVYEASSSSGSFDAPAAETAMTSVTIATPAGAAYFLVAASNWVCGAGSKE